MHRLFDQGYVTVTPDGRLNVSERLRRDYENGRTYYPYHGATIAAPLSGPKPSDEFLAWHNDHVYRL
jgi:putative restriction endonuclease